MTTKPAAQCAECQSMKGTVGHIHHQKLAAHTPLPWKSDGSYIIGSNNLSVAKATIYKGTNEVKDIENEEKARANAAFIVRAVNAHEELLSCLKEIYEWTDYKNTDWAKRSAQAIAKSGGVQ